MSKDTICAVIVTYNRKKLLLKCLKALKDQSYPLDAIYLVDNNSNDGTPELLLLNNYIEKLPPDNLNQNWEKISIIKNLTNNKDLKLHYVRLYENTGGAGGFHVGVKKAYKKGYDWLWLMDDDSEPDKNALKKLTKYFSEDNISALANVVKNVDGKIDYGHNGYINFKRRYRNFVTPVENIQYQNPTIHVDFTSFVGILINRLLIKKIGFPKKEFFIYGDDADYSIRLNKHGKILLITDSFINHNYVSNLNLPMKKFFGLAYVKRPYSSYWLFYYTIRNVIWYGRNYSRNRISFYSDLIYDYIKHLAGIILFDDNKFKRIKMITNAYLDGLKGNFDNNKPKRILYR